MGRKAKNEMEPPCCDLGKITGYRVEAMVSVDERGQLVLPKELREKFGVNAGEKLVVISRQNEGEVCCISLIKTDYLLSLLDDRLGPIMDELPIKKGCGE